MSMFHQIQFMGLFVAFMIARMQSMITERPYEFIGDYDEYIIGYDNRKTFIETPKNVIKLNFIGYSLYYGAQLFELFFNYLGEI